MAILTPLERINMLLRQVQHKGGPMDGIGNVGGAVGVHAAAATRTSASEEAQESQAEKMREAQVQKVAANPAGMGNKVDLFA
jgi:hypothetical protein